MDLCASRVDVTISVFKIQKVATVTNFGLVNHENCIYTSQ